jgi:hypothetical protein
MSRSGYSYDLDQGMLNRYRANVDRAIRGKRGQAFLREMAAALDAMPVKELIAGDVVRDDKSVCAIGSVALARKVDVTELDIYDKDEVGRAFRIAPALAAEIAFLNDDDFAWKSTETPERRWQRMRRWVEGQIIKPTPQRGETEGEKSNG